MAFPTSVNSINKQQNAFPTSVNKIIRIPAEIHKSEDNQIKSPLHSAPIIKQDNAQGLNLIG